MSTIAVTGASGHIGNVVCRQLLAKGHRVKALYHRDTRALNELDLTLVEGSVLDPEAVSELVNGCDLVIHCAAIISIDGDRTGEVFRTNTEGPRNVLQACIHHGVKRLIHVSSVHAVMEVPADAPFDESRPYKTAEHFSYDFSKATGEQIMLSEAGEVEVVIVRPSAVIGPFDFKPSKLGSAIASFRKQRIVTVPPGGYDMVDVRDVASSILSAMEKGRSGEVYLLSGKFQPFGKLIDTIDEVTHRSRWKIPVPWWMLYLSLPFARMWSILTRSPILITRESIVAIRHGHRNMDHSKAEKELGHRPRALDLTLSDYFQWLDHRDTPIV